MPCRGAGGPTMATDAALSTRIEVTRRALPIGRWALTGAVLGWFALLILVPTIALIQRALAGGLGPFVRALTTADALRAFGLTLGITAAATAINTLFGVAFAVVLVRHRFRGRMLADGVVDLPFAVSPVIAGLMLIVVYGPGGWLGRSIEASGFRVVYALPGMVLACLFVTLPFVVRQ